MAVLLLFALRAAGGELAPGHWDRWEQWMTAGAVLVGVVLAAVLLPNGRAVQLNRSLVPLGNLILGLAFPFLLWLGKGFCEKRR